MMSLDVARWRHVAVIGGYLCYRLTIRDAWKMRSIAPKGYRMRAWMRRRLAEWVIAEIERKKLNRVGNKRRSVAERESDKREAVILAGKCGRCRRHRLEKGKTMCSNCLEYLRRRSYAVYHGE